MKVLRLDAVFSALVAGVLLCAHPTTQAATTSIGGTYKVNRTMVTTRVDPDRPGGFMWGGCMARLKPVPQSLARGCFQSPADITREELWVSFSCDGVDVPKDFAYRGFDSAQLALATNRQVFVFIDTTLNASGYCVFNRIDVQ